MPDATAYERARGRAEAKYGFFKHTAVYGAVMALLLVINLLTFDGAFWVIWPFLGWGLAVGIHGARVFLIADRDSILESMTAHELAQSGSGQRD